MKDISLRVDKNIAFNILEFDKVGDRQTAIILKALLVYFSNAYQSDLFGYGTLDPYDFAKKMNIDKDNLFRKHPSPKFISDSNLSVKRLYERERNNEKYNPDTRVWDSYLENALYILFSSPLIEEYKGVTDEHNYVGLKNFLILRDISIFSMPENMGRTKKIYYKYKLDDYFERNLRKYFVQIEINIFNACKDKGVEGFYLQLINIYQTYKKKGINVYHWKLQDLLQYFSISNELEIKYQKRKLSIQLDKMEKLVAQQIPGIKFEWIAGDNQRWKYIPTVKWDKIDVEQTKISDFKALDDVFYKHLKRNLLEIYISQEEGLFENKEEFYIWLKDEESLDLKISCYVSTYSLYNRIQKYPSPQTLARTFFTTNIRKAKNIDELEKCFSPITS
tara:strand:- start:3650 stop:4822 length:1173 start_codon:yes stop_codon:yes gene_type:complete